MFNFFNIFKKKEVQSTEETYTLTKSQMLEIYHFIETTIDAFRDNKITKEEAIDIKKHAYDLLLEFNLDKK